jgi:hypothetical protein
LSAGSADRRGAAACVQRNQDVATLSVVGIRDRYAMVKVSKDPSAPFSRDSISGA